MPSSGGCRAVSVGRESTAEVREESIAAMRVGATILML